MCNFRELNQRCDIHDIPLVHGCWKCSVKPGRKPETPDCDPSISTDLLYGVVEWFAGNPALDGMKCFVNKERAVEYAKDQEDMAIGTPYDVKYTIIRIEKAI